MAAPTVVLFLLTKTQAFHLIRPVCALGTFPTRGRLEKRLSFLQHRFLKVPNVRIPDANASGILCYINFSASFLASSRE
ncbi:MAG: hypothetical protein J6J19_05220, partial [Oscillospiraceae bacterium]|nr:hypothetical protein [Oscillospiraceae bacterium]